MTRLLVSIPLSSCSVSRMTGRQLMATTLFQVARLTRPARLRCRPILATTIGTRWRTSAAGQPVRRAEVEDYEKSLELSKDVDEDRVAHGMQ